MEFWKLPQTQAWAILLGMALLPNGSTVHVGQTSYSKAGWAVSGNVSWDCLRGTGDQRL